MQESKPTTIQHVFGSKLGSIRRMLKVYSETEVKAIIVYLITDLLKSFNYSRTMNVDQVGRLTNMIISCYPDYMPEDFKRCFEGMKRGKYGKFFEGMDENKILDAIEVYGIERDNEIIELRKNESNEHKIQSKEVGEVFLPVLKKIVEKYDVEKNGDPKPIRQRTPAEKKANEWMAQFDKLHHKKPITKGGIRFIKRYGKVMELSEFLDYKLSQFTGFKHMEEKLK